uniref:GtrA family protein n=1 Tax=Nakamurella sp. TaxID=1869182 RepID=UPI003B3BDB2A
MTLAATAPRPTRSPVTVRRRSPVAGGGWPGQLLRFALVGGGASALQLAAYAFLADAVGAQPANVASWLVATLLATELHRRFSFGGPNPTTGPALRPGRRPEVDHVVGVVTGLATLLLSMLALAALDDPSDAAGVLALVAVNGSVGLLRFAVLRWWLLGRPASGGIGPRRGRS